MPRRSIVGMDDLMMKKKEIKNTAIKHFIKNSIMLDKEEEREYTQKIDKTIDAKFKHIKKKTLNEFNCVYEQVAKHLVSQIEDDLA